MSSNWLKSSSKSGNYVSLDPIPEYLFIPHSTCSSLGFLCETLSSRGKTKWKDGTGILSQLSTSQSGPGVEGTTFMLCSLTQQFGQGHRSPVGEAMLGIQVGIQECRWEFLHLMSGWPSRASLVQGCDGPLCLLLPELTSSCFSQFLRE